MVGTSLFEEIGPIDQSAHALSFTSPESADAHVDQSSAQTGPEEVSPTPFTDYLLLVKAGIAISTAARQLGIDVATGMAWATKAGIVTCKRPSRARGDRRIQMIRALQKGADKTRVAEIGGVSVETVTRILRTELGLQEAWHHERMRARQRRARRSWLRAIQQNPLSGVKAVRLLEPAAFAWLYRNDRCWLLEQSASLERPRPDGGLRVDWDLRDTKLAEDVRRVLLDIQLTVPDHNVRLWQIYQRIPELKAKLQRLDRLPLTRKAILEGVRRARV